MDYFSETDLKAFRDQLLEIRNTLLQELIEEHDTLSETHSYVEDLGEMAFENSDKDIISALSFQQQKTLKQIDAALENINKGKYGICHICSKPVEKERLNLLPFTDLCSSHKDLGR